MVKMYKLLNEDMTSRGGMQWSIGKTNTATGKGSELCTNGVLHCYTSPNLAALFAPIHLDVSKKLRLFEIECSNVLSTDGLKAGTKSQTPVKEITLPKFTKEQRVAFALKCALLVFKESWFVSYATKWLSGEDRTESAAESAAWSATRSAAESAAWSAAWSAARSAARSATESAARSAAWSARSATWSARSATWSARSATESAANFESIAQWVLDNI